MIEFKDQWNLEMALDVLQHQTVESAVWAEAVEWLLLYGPPEIQELICQASNLATRQCFPGLNAEAATTDGQPCYSVQRLAEALGMKEDEVLYRLKMLEFKQGARHLYDESETDKIH